MGRKPGVMEPDALTKFVEAAGDRLIVVDVRNPDFNAEPGDGKVGSSAPHLRHLSMSAWDVTR